MPNYIDSKQLPNGDVYWYEDKKAQDLLHDHEILCDVPANAVFTDTTYESLKNPYPIMFTMKGKTIDYYDGSESKTIEISSPAEYYSNFVIEASKWSDTTTTSGGRNYYTYNINCTIRSQIPSITMAAGDGSELPSEEQQEAFNLIKYAIPYPADQRITLFALDEKPTVDFNVTIEGVSL